MTPSVSSSVRASRLEVRRGDGGHTGKKPGSTPGADYCLSQWLADVGFDQRQVYGVKSCPPPAGARHNFEPGNAATAPGRVGVRVNREWVDENTQAASTIKTRRKDQTVSEQTTVQA